MLRPKCFVPDRPVLTHRPTAATPPPLPRPAIDRVAPTGCPGGGIGRRAGFRYLWPQGRGSSSLLLGTIHNEQQRNSCRAEPSTYTGTICPRPFRSVPSWPSTPKQWASIPIATGCVWCSFPPGTAPRTWCRSVPSPSAASATPAPISRVCSLTRVPQAHAFRPVRRRRPPARPGHHRLAGPLHQDRRQAGAHLHRPSRPA